MKIEQSGVRLTVTNIVYTGGDIGDDLSIVFLAREKKTTIRQEFTHQTRLLTDKVLFVGEGEVHLSALVTERDFITDDSGSSAIRVIEYGNHTLSINVDEASQVLAWSGWVPELRRTISGVQASFECSLFASFANYDVSDKIPRFDALTRHYPAYDQRRTDQVKRDIGGKVNYPWLDNSCAIRISRTLNYNSLELPKKAHSLHVISGADGKWYSYRVAELRLWLVDKIGAPQFDHRKAKGIPFDKRILKDVTGIICLEISFSNATGHFDLWDGSYFTSERGDRNNSKYWAMASRISLWVAT